MTSLQRWGAAAGALMIGLVVAAGSAWEPRAMAAAGPADAASAAGRPVVRVRTQPMRQEALVETLDAFGDVLPGQVMGISFARGGQVTRLVAVAGHRVAKGAALATLVPDPASQVAFAQAVTAADAADREAHRLQELLALRLATQSQVDAAIKAHGDAVGNLAALRQAGGGAASTTLTAPFDGVVISVAVAQGDRVAACAPIMQFGRVDTLRVQVGIEPAERGHVHVGSAVTLTAMVSGAEPIAARIGELQNIVDSKTQLVDAVIAVPAAQAAGLVPGMRVHAIIELGRQTAWAAPRNAVLSDERGSYVFQVAGGKAHRVDVTTRIEAGDRVGFDGPVDASRPLVVLGNYELQDGMLVREDKP